MLLDENLKSLAYACPEKMKLSHFLDKAIQSMKDGNEKDAIDQLKSGLNLAHLNAENEWVLRFNAYLILFI